MSRALLVVNPSSGSEEAPKYAELAEAKLNEYFDEVTVKHTETDGDATRFTRRAADEGYDSVFVMGGDGTVNEGICGIAEHPDRPTFGFFPLGTVNDLARSLNLSLDPEEAIAQFDPERTKPLDIGKVNDSYFMNVVAAGAIPEALNEVSIEDKTKWGPLAYFIGGLKQFADNPSYDFRVTVDGETHEFVGSTVVIGLTGSISGFETMIPDAEVDDGKMHVICLRDSSILETIQAIPDLLRGVEDDTDRLSYYVGEHVLVELADEEGADHPINVDGDEGDPLPMELELLPGHLTVYSGPEV